MTTGKTIALTIWTFVGKVKSLFLIRCLGLSYLFFQGDLIDRMPEELLMEVCDIVQEAVIKAIPKKKKCRKAKWLSEEGLQIAEERREAKGKEKRKYIPI